MYGRDCGNLSAFIFTATYTYIELEKNALRNSIMQNTNQQKFQHTIHFS